MMIFTALCKLLVNMEECLHLMSSNITHTHAQFFNALLVCVTVLLFLLKYTTWIEVAIKLKIMATWINVKPEKLKYFTQDKIPHLNNK